MRLGEIAMSLNREYASFLIAASNIYAAQGEAKCSKAESQFEQDLFKLFTQASNAGMALQDIVVVTSTAIAVMLTKQAALPSTKRQPVAKPDAKVIALRPRAS
jgi:hypothetical protein